MLNPPIKPHNGVMLAKEYNGESNVEGWYISEKLDGHRAYWTGTELLSRNNKTIAVPDWFFVSLKHAPPLDGELWLGRNRFQELGSIVRCHCPDIRWKRVQYCIFDLPESGLLFRDAVEQMINMPVLHTYSFIKPVDQIVCRSKSHLDIMMKSIMDQGGEGIMLRDPLSLYQRTRSKSLLKYKLFQKEVATVTGHSLGLGRHFKRMGTLHCKAPCGTTVDLGTGFSDEERENPPPVGSVVRFAYANRTTDGRFRFPAYLGRKE